MPLVLQGQGPTLFLPLHLTNLVYLSSHSHLWPEGMESAPQVLDRRTTLNEAPNTTTKLHGASTSGGWIFPPDGAEM